MMTREDIVDGLTEYIRTRFLDGDAGLELGPETLLLEWGILSSMNTVQLLNHVREEWGISVGPQYITGRNFASVSRIADLLEQFLPRAEVGALIAPAHRTTVEN
jgi:acyl carrier protein